jgi:hypothetical protein
MPVQGVVCDDRHTFLGVCIDAGQRVLAAIGRATAARCVAQRRPDEERRAVRGCSTTNRVVLGGQRIAPRCLRARLFEDREVSLPTFERAAAGDRFDAATPAAVAAGVPTRHYASTQEPVLTAHHPSAASKIAVSRRFVHVS